MASARLIILLIIVPLAQIGMALGSYHSPGSCTSSQQRTALADTVASGCRPREVLIDLGQQMSNSTSASNLLQVMPQFRSVRRCGGDCDRVSRRCVPTAVKTTAVEVMVVRSMFPSGSGGGAAAAAAQTECGVVDVEEHLNCACDCPVSEEHCRLTDQYYDSGSCRCLCRDQQARNACIERGMQWDPEHCLCGCPVSSWRVCSSGYVFDFADTCGCVVALGVASTQVYTALLGLAVFAAVTIISLVAYYRRRLRYFQRQLDLARENYDSEDETQRL